MCRHYTKHVHSVSLVRSPLNTKFGYLLISFESNFPFPEVEAEISYDQEAVSEAHLWVQLVCIERQQRSAKETMDTELQPEVQVAWLRVVNVVVKLQVFGIATVPDAIPAFA